MLGRGIWALQQPWRSTGDKLFALAFVTALTAFAGYKLLIVALPAASGLRGPVSDNVACGILSLVFVAGAIFVYLVGDDSISERWMAIPILAVGDPGPRRSSVRAPEGGSPAARQTERAA